MLPRVIVLGGVLFLTVSMTLSEMMMIFTICIQ